MSDSLTSQAKVEEVENMNQIHKKSSDQSLNLNQSDSQGQPLHQIQTQSHRKSSLKQQQSSLKVNLRQTKSQESLNDSVVSGNHSTNAHVTESDLGSRLDFINAVMIQSKTNADSHKYDQLQQLVNKWETEVKTLLHKTAKLSSNSESQESLDVNDATVTSDLKVPQVKVTRYATEQGPIGSNMQQQTENENTLNTSDNLNLNNLSRLQQQTLDQSKSKADSQSQPNQYYCELRPLIHGLRISSRTVLNSDFGREFSNKRRNIIIFVILQAFFISFPVSRAAFQEHELRTDDELYSYHPKLKSICLELEQPLISIGGDSKATRLGRGLWKSLEAICLFGLLLIALHLANRDFALLFDGFRTKTWGRLRESEITSEANSNLIVTESSNFKDSESQQDSDDKDSSVNPDIQNYYSLESRSSSNWGNNEVFELDIFLIKGTAQEQYAGSIMLLSLMFFKFFLTVLSAYVNVDSDFNQQVQGPGKTGKNANESNLNQRQQQLQVAQATSSTTLNINKHKDTVTQNPTVQEFDIWDFRSHFRSSSGGFATIRFPTKLVYKVARNPNNTSNNNLNGNSNLNNLNYESDAEQFITKLTSIGASGNPGPPPHQSRGGTLNQNMINSGLNQNSSEVNNSMNLMSIFPNISRSPSSSQRLLKLGTASTNLNNRPLPTKFGASDSQNNHINSDSDEDNTKDNVVTNSTVFQIDQNIKYDRLEDSPQTSIPQIQSSEQLSPKSQTEQNSMNLPGTVGAHNSTEDRERIVGSTDGGVIIGSNDINENVAQTLNRSSVLSLDDRYIHN